MRKTNSYRVHIDRDEDGIEVDRFYIYVLRPDLQRHARVELLNLQGPYKLGMSGDISTRGSGILLCPPSLVIYLEILDKTELYISPTQDELDTIQNYKFK